jgi:hypothetical protein
MAQVTISEDHYRELVARAQAHGTTPDALADALIGQTAIGSLPRYAPSRRR